MNGFREVLSDEEGWRKACPVLFGMRAPLHPRGRWLQLLFNALQRLTWRSVNYKVTKGLMRLEKQVLQTRKAKR